MISMFRNDIVKKNTSKFKGNHHLHEATREKSRNFYEDMKKREYKDNDTFDPPVVDTKALGQLFFSEEKW
jgi:hypothetical protein